MASPGPGRGDLPDDFYDRARPACGEVLVDGYLAGGGALIDPTGLVVTAAHLFSGPENRLEFRPYGGDRLDATLEALDFGRDLALLRLPSREDPYPALEVADTMPPAGKEIYLLSSPLGRHAVLLRGMVARNDTTFEYYSNLKRYVEVIHIATTVQGKASGGPWLDRSGRVVAVQSGTLITNSVPAAVAHAAPLDGAAALRETRRNQRTPTIGAAFEEIWEQNQSFLSQYPPKTDGLVVRCIVPEGSAAKAGIEDGQVVVEVDGAPVKVKDALIRRMRSKKPGDTITLTRLLPDGRTEKAQLELTVMQRRWLDAGDGQEEPRATGGGQPTVGRERNRYPDKPK